MKAADVEAARTLLAALQNPVASEAEPPPEFSDPEPPEAGRPRAQQRRPYFAAALTFFLPGGGHLYARRPWTAAVLVIGYVIAIGLAASWKTSEAAGGLIALLLLVDLIGGVRAAQTYNRGVDASRGRQLSIGFALLVFVVGVSQGSAAYEAMKRERIARELGNLETACTDRALTVTHRGAEPRFVSVTLIRVAERSRLMYASDARGISQLQPIGPSEATLGAGAALTVGLNWIDGNPSACKRERGAGFLLDLDLPGRCVVDYDVAVREQPGGPVIAHAEWSCALP